MLSLAAIIYLVARAIPRVGELINPSDKKSYLEDFFKKIPWHKLDALISSWSEKILRKLKIFILKLDNLVSKYLNKFRTTEMLNKEAAKPDIFENKAEDKQEKSE